MFQTVLEQAHFTDEDKNLDYRKYDPSKYYDASIIHEYGGYKKVEQFDMNHQNDQVVASDDFHEYKYRKQVSRNSSKYSTQKHRRHKDAPISAHDNRSDCDDLDEAHDEDIDDDNNKDRHGDDDANDNDSKQLKTYAEHLTQTQGQQNEFFSGPFQ